jgi:P27 family predicted phage terminase small subunit
MARMKSLPKKYKDYAKQLKALIESKGVLEQVDLKLVDEAAELLYVIDEAKKDYMSRGVMVNVRTSDKEPLMQINQSVALHQSTLKSLEVVLTKLGMTIQERHKLKLNVKEEAGDGFDD